MKSPGKESLIAYAEKTAISYWNHRGERLYWESPGWMERGFPFPIVPESGFAFHGSLVKTENSLHSKENFISYSSYSSW
jgi:hypothetical protein